MICWKSFYADLVLNFLVIIIGAQFFLSILKNNLETDIFFPRTFWWTERRAFILQKYFATFTNVFYYHHIWRSIHYFLYCLNYTVKEIR